MPLSKKRDRERKRKQRRLQVKFVMSSADIRALRAAKLDPAYIEVGLTVHEAQESYHVNRARVEEGL